MSLLGIHLTLLIGPTVPIPAPAPLIDALSSVEVTHQDVGRSGFQMTFQAGRSGLTGLMDYPLLSSPLLKPFNRVIIVVTINVTPRVLIDGIITHQELTPSDQPGRSTISIIGEDISVMMDLEEKSAEHPAQDETIIANKLILSYAQYGLIPMVIPPVVIDPPIPIERTPVQQETDLAFLNSMADRYGYVFYIIPGPAPFTNTAYWGPPVRVGVPQSALTVNMGAETNVDSFNVRYNAMMPTLVEGQIQDRLTNQSFPVQTFASLRPPLAVFPAWLFNQPNVRRTQFREGGLNVMEAYARAQGQTDASVDAVVAEGNLDADRYGNLLQPRALVGVRGAGYSYDGFWYVKQVTHSIRIGSYQQRFTVTREGLGSTTPVVIP
ncbi:MAG TPA: hypothetical protein VMW65_09135 [Chloroflexota bacterium]|nr:hypothetical protein [Chloroflexota bacterium]